LNKHKKYYIKKKDNWLNYWAIICTWAELGGPNWREVNGNRRRSRLRLLFTLLTAAALRRAADAAATADANGLNEEAEEVETFPAEGGDLGEDISAVAAVSAESISSLKDFLRVEINPMT